MVNTSSLQTNSDEFRILEVDLPIDIAKRLQQQAIKEGFASVEDYCVFLLELECGISFPNDPNLKD